MNVSLTKELEIWVEDLVKSGMYQSSSEVIRAALRLLHKTETLPETQLEAIKAAVKQGQDDILAGRHTENHPQLLADVKKRRSKT
jgi:antitoxin ParD1/3/4